METIKQLRRQVTKRISDIVSPHMWESGYRSVSPETLGKERPGTFVFAFAPEKGSDYRWRCMGGLFESETCFHGFYSEEGNEGLFSALGGGMVCHPFGSFCVEDLLTIETWLSKNFAKELTKSQNYRQSRS